MTDPEAISYARTWNSQYYCPFKTHDHGFQCVAKPHENFDVLRGQLPFGAPIPQMWIAHGFLQSIGEVYWCWSDAPFIWE